MNNDLDIIIKKYPHEWDSLRVYAIGDVHVGAPDFDEASVRKKLKIIQEDPAGVLALCGDVGNFGLRSCSIWSYRPGGNRTISGRSGAPWIIIQYRYRRGCLV